MATPLGNPGDLSPRAREILAGADIILAEDTRRAAKLLHECGISPRARLLSFFEHNEEQRQAAVLQALRQGANVALISDAGTPLLADPGYRLTRACRREGIAVSPAPGPSAPVAALSAAGLPPIPFTFLGFLPRGTGDRKALFASFAQVPCALVFFERKDRLAESLELALPVLGPREIAICRELTKEHEEFILGRLEDFQNLARNLLGEITVIVGPPEKARRTPQSLVEEIIKEGLACGLKNRQAAMKVLERTSGWSSKEIYAMIAALKTSLFMLLNIP